MNTIEKQSALAESKNTDFVPRFLRPAGAARYSSTSRAWLYPAISSGKLKTHLIGGCRLIDRFELDRFILAHSS